jgi:hypothetical protein
MLFKGTVSRDFSPPFSPICSFWFCVARLEMFSFFLRIFEELLDYFCASPVSTKLVKSVHRQNVEVTNAEWTKRRTTKRRTTKRRMGQNAKCQNVE